MALCCSCKSCPILEQNIGMFISTLHKAVYKIDGRLQKMLYPLNPAGGGVHQRMCPLQNSLCKLGETDFHKVTGADLFRMIVPVTNFRFYIS